ncbi:MAG: hypothetical protein RIS70_395 [Planctomycetota bacterium]
MHPKIPGIPYATSPLPVESPRPDWTSTRLSRRLCIADLSRNVKSPASARRWQGGDGVVISGELTRRDANRLYGDPTNLWSFLC